MFGDDSAGRLRTPTPSEEDLISYLLSADFVGAVGLRSQIPFIRVRELDVGGSLKIECSGAERAKPKYRVPVEARYVDNDGVTVHVLLHVVRGLLSELEVLREDSGRVITPPTPAKRLDLCAL